jgi:MFS family permease
MIDTITPAGCGSRQRYAVALLAFSLAAVAAAAVLGAAVGMIGGWLAPPVGIALAVALAGLGIARELGLRIPVPQLRRQVPERWRREWPLPLWSAGYGAGLGLGFLTHQVTFTYWAALAAIAAVGSVALGAVAMALFGLGRALMVVLPTLGGEGRRARILAVMAGARRPLAAANVAALAVIGIAVMAQPATAAVDPAGTGVVDPSASGSILARAQLSQGASTVVVTAPGRPGARFPSAQHPSVNASLLAFTDARGISVVDWTSGRRVYRINGAVEKPAIAWPWIAYLRRARTGTALELRHIVRGTRRVIDNARPDEDLGRPALKGGRLAWHYATGRRSEVWLANVRRPSRKRLVAFSRTAIHVNPSLSTTHIAWVDQRAETSLLKVQRLRNRRTRTIARVIGRDRIFWTTALTRRRAYVTRWSLRGKRARIIAARVR